MVAVKDMTGKTFARLTVTSRYYGEQSPRNTSAFWNCRCSCGNLTVVSGVALRTGNTQSCGCLIKDASTQRFLKHGHKRGKSNGGYSATYTAWCHMIRRCYKETEHQYHDYGGRGITVCDRWRNDFKNFLDDMGEKPRNTQIDRIDNNGNYEPANCRWATKIQQARNTRANTYLEYNGERLTHAEWAERTGLSQDLIKKRKYLGWSPKEILSTEKYGKGEVSHRERASFNNRQNSQFVSFNGRKLTVTELARETGKDRRKLSWRIKQGWSVEEALRNCDQRKEEQ